MDARDRKRYEVLVAISLKEEWVADEMCGCRVVPLNYWLHPDGTWSRHSCSEDGAVHADSFIKGMCVGWVIGCPFCGRNFAAGLKVPSVR